MQFRRSLTGRALGFPKGQSGIDMIPMIDIVFQLVLFFLVSTTFAMLPGIALDLPESSTAEASVVTPLCVTIINRDEVYLNDERINFDNLAVTLPGFYTEEQSTPQSVTLEADESVSYGLIVEALDILRKSGFQNINLHTVNRQ